MSRLKDLLRVAAPSTCNTQQISTGTTPDVVGLKSQSLLRVASTSPRNTQQAVLLCCAPVAQHLHTAQQFASSDQWQEFESLLAIIGPAYRTPEHEYSEIRNTARSDLDCALTAYRDMAAQISGRSTNIVATLPEGGA